MHIGSLFALSFLFVMLWSSGWTASHFAVGDVSAMTLLSARYVIVCVVLTVLVTILGHWRRLNIRVIICHLVIGALSHAVLLLAGLSAFELGVSAGLVAFVAALHPMFTAVFSCRITQEKATLRQWQGLLLGLCAVSLLLSDGYQSGLTPYALVLPFVAVIALSLGSLLHKRLELQDDARCDKPVPVTLMLLIHSVGAMIILLPLSTHQGVFHFNFTLNQWMVLLWLALVVSLGAYGVLLILLRQMSSMKVASLSYLVPPTTLIQSYMIFGHPISLMDIVGQCIAAVGVYLVMKTSVVERAGSKVLLSNRLVQYFHRPTPVGGSKVD